MNTMTQETPRLQVIEQPAPADLASSEGSKLHTSYFEFRVSFPVMFEVAVPKLSDEDLLLAANKTGTFEFLNAPEEDAYNDLLPKRE
jgi:hypothetical protein